MPRIIAIAQNKGGNGKTTTAVNLAAGIRALNNEPVLVVDLDPQANATLHLGIEPSELSVTVADVLTAKRPAADAIVPTSNDVDLLPSSSGLAAIATELVRYKGGQNRLASALEPIRDRYKAILIDCPPSLGMLTQNALQAATEVLLPVQAEYFALHGLGQILDFLGSQQTQKLPCKVLVTLFDVRRNLCKQVVEQMRDELGRQVCQAVIRSNVSLAEAPIKGRDIFTYAPRSHGAEDYQALTQELFA